MRDKAVLLSYRRGEPPIIEAAGTADLARELQRTARRYGIPVHSDRDLTEALLREDAVPEDLYPSVARAFAATGQLVKQR